MNDEVMTKTWWNNIITLSTQKLVNQQHAQNLRLKNWIWDFTCLLTNL